MDLDKCDYKFAKKLMITGKCIENGFLTDFVGQIRHKDRAHTVKFT